VTASTLINVPDIPVGDGFENLFDWLSDNMAAVFDAISNSIDFVLTLFIGLLEAPDPVLLAAAFALLGLLTKGWKFALIAFIGLLLIIGMGQWAAAMQTLALVLASAVVAVLIAVPLGILAARNRWASTVIRPIMDLMQTMPGFVWLVPVVTLFGIGVVPGVVATIIFALPPGVRLTELGIRKVDEEMVEAAYAFGATPRQTLLGVQLPLALPTIMAGVNQVIMMCLSMAVVAGLVGAAGLGGQVTSAIATLNIGLGFEAGLSVVILAIYLDRVTATLENGTSGIASRLWRRKPKKLITAKVETSSETAGAEPSEPPSETREKMRESAT
jgi:glycine betaine/proline transport system permease protein